MLAQRLFYLRQKNKKTQSQMARLLGISRQAYGYYEKGEREPDSQAINLLADYFNVSTDYLFGRTDNPAAIYKQLLNDEQEMFANMRYLSERLRDERDIRGWSQVYVAEQLGLKESSTYANWECGTGKPDPNMLKELSDLYDVSIEYLMGITDIKPKNKKLDDKRAELVKEIMSLPEDQQSLIKNMVKALIDKREQ